MLPHQRRSRHAQAAINLLDLGRSPADAIATARTWAATQARRSGEAIGSLADRLCVARTSSVGDEPRLVLSGHHGLYPAIYPLLAKAVASRRVAAIIGEQSSEHEGQLLSLAKFHGFDIDFVDSDAGIIRNVRCALAASHAILLIDVPWSRSETPPDREAPTEAGAFRYRSTFSRFVKLVDRRPSFAFVSERGDRFELEVVEAEDLEDALGMLGRLIAGAPHEYERLDAMHGFFRFDRSTRCAVLFAVGDEHFVLHGPSRECWRISDERLLAAIVPGEPLDRAAVARTATMLDRRIDVVLSI